MNLTKYGISADNIPKHVAIIMDGNGRWASIKNLEVTAGHKKGSENLEKVVEIFNKFNIHIVTVYAFSSENWKRSEKEVSGLMRLLEFFFKNKLNKLIKNETRIKIIGDISRFPDRIRKILINTEEKTKKYKKNLIQIGLNYGSRDEIVRSVKNICNDFNNKKIAISDIDEKLISRYLDTDPIPDPDLLIRTGGEYRLSNFLLYQIAYSEIFVTNTLWPDFGEKDIVEAIKNYQERDRRFGGRK